eukprot:1133884-Rhodomonas_salina.3
MAALTMGHQNKIDEQNNSLLQKNSLLRSTGRARALVRRPVRFLTLRAAVASDAAAAAQFEVAARAEAVAAWARAEESQLEQRPALRVLVHLEASGLALLHSCVVGLLHRQALPSHRLHQHLRPVGERPFHHRYQRLVGDSPLRVDADQGF